MSQPSGGQLPIGQQIVIDGRGQPTLNDQPVQLPTNTEFQFTPPPRWAEGFTLGTPDDLPKSRREVYDRSGRKSQVLIKKLQAVAGE